MIITTTEKFVFEREKKLSSEVVLEDFTFFQKTCCKYISVKVLCNINTVKEKK